MAIVVNVFGPAQVQVGLGASNAYQNLGYSIDGIELEDEFVEVPIKSDVFLDAVRDVQYSGVQGLIKCTLIEYDPTVFAAVQAITFGGTAGTNLAAGSLLVAGSLTFPVKIVGTGVNGTDSFCRIYNCCYPVGSQTKKVGTHATVCTVTFKALIPHTNSTMAGNVTWTTC